MRDIRTDLRERLQITVKQRAELEARERRLRALLRDEEVSQAQLPPEARQAPRKATGGVRLREFILGSLRDGDDWSLERLKLHAHDVGLTTVGASGRSLNITLVNLLRQGWVTRLRDGRWRLRDEGIQLPLNFELPAT